jgi:hypothetical protein
MHDDAGVVCQGITKVITIITPHACTRGKVIDCGVVIVQKIATSRDLGI